MFFVDDVTQTPAHKSINNHEIDLLSLSLSLSTRVRSSRLRGQAPIIIS